MPMKVLHVIPSLEYGGAAAQLLVLARGLPAGKIEARVCVLGGEGPFALPFRASPATVEPLGWRRWFAVGPPRQLRRLLRRFAPDMVHACGPPALRAVSLAAGRAVRRFWVSRPRSPRRGP